MIPQQGTYSFHWSQQQPLEVLGGNVKILDPLTFPVASNFAAALFTVQACGMRELHWHTASDEWTYFLAGQGRLTAYVAPEASVSTLLFDLHSQTRTFVLAPFPSLCSGYMLTLLPVYAEDFGFSGR